VSTSRVDSRSPRNARYEPPTTTISTVGAPLRVSSAARSSRQRRISFASRSGPATKLESASDGRATAHLPLDRCRDPGTGAALTPSRPQPFAVCQTSAMAHRGPGQSRTNAGERGRRRRRASRRRRQGDCRAARSRSGAADRRFPIRAHGGVRGGSRPSLAAVSSRSRRPGARRTERPSGRRARLGAHGQPGGRAAGQSPRPNAQAW
jgi:hypothetical protein